MTGDETPPDVETAIERLRSGSIRLHELEESFDHATAAAARRAFLAHETGVELSAIGQFTFDPAEAEPNVENMVGAAQLPLGVVGPLEIAGASAEGEFYLPMATTEGALLASVNRGCAVIRAADGADARVLKRGMTRAPVFAVDGIEEAASVLAWLEDNRERLAAAAEGTTDHGELLGIDPYVVGDSIFLRFRFDTKDAMGMNMVTLATRAASELLEEETPASLVALSGNLCVDKKPAAINAILGRGRTVTADVVVPRTVVEERLHTTPEAIEAVNTRKNLVGSAKAGSLGFNAHAANVIAAMFIATGQDAAQVVEGSNAITTVDVRDGDLYLAVSLASLEVGTVGGGTRLPTQAEALDLLGIRGGGSPPGDNADALAEIVAGGVLAGELSLLGALASRNLSTAHEELGR